MRAAIQIAQEVRAFHNYDFSGVDCRYVRLSDEIGLKCYYSPEMGHMTYSFQRMAANKGFAPECWGFSEMDGKCAYFTQHVQVISNMNDYYSEERERLSREGKQLGRQCFDTWKINDLGERNLGVIDGRAVIIDFSRVGYQDAERKWDDFCGWVCSPV